MFSEHESSFQTGDRPGASQSIVGRRSRPDETRGGSGTDGQKMIRTGGNETGGSPIPNPSQTHQTVAAIDQLWESYRGTADDGQFVWVRPTCETE